MVIFNSSIFILSFPVFGKFDIFHGCVGAVRTGITQFLKLTLASTIWMSHALFIPRILSRPFIVAFGISKKMNQNFDTKGITQRNTLKAIFFVDVFK
jgi:hypothetical protein